MAPDYRVGHDGIVLRLLGQLRLEASGTVDPSVQARLDLLNARRRVMALLAMLATSTRPLERERLADVFWGESDPARARHSLAEALSVIRSAFGAPVLETRAPEVQLAHDRLDVDVLAFRSAVQRGDTTAAVALYAGDFLDGVFVDRAPRFEEWASLQRDELRRHFVMAASAECTRLAAGMHHDAAASLALRWLRAEPLDPAAARAWLSALAAPGTRDALMRTRERFDTWRTQLSDEFELEPEPDVIDLMAEVERRLAARPTAAVPTRSDEVSIDGAHARGAMPIDAPVIARTEDDRRHHAPAVVAPRVAARSRVSVQRMGVAVALLAVTTVLAWRYNVFGVRFDRSLVGTDRAPITVVVADAELAAADSSLGGAVTLAVRTSLAGGRTVRVMPADRARELRRLSSRGSTDPAVGDDGLTQEMARVIAARAGAGAVLVPVLAGVGPRFLVALRLVRVRDGQEIAILRAEPVDSGGLLPTLDKLTRRARERFGASRSELASTASLPDVTTASLRALQYLAEGYDAFEAARYPAAADAYRRALALDSGFALAWSALGSAHAVSNRPLSAESAFVQVERHLDRLSDREQAIARANMARWRGQPDSAIAIRARWLDRRPDDIAMRKAQGFDLLRARRYAEAATLLERVLAVDSLDGAAWLNLGVARRAARGAPRAQAVAAYASAIRLDPTLVTNPVSAIEFGGLLVEAGMLDSARAIFRETDGMSASLRGRMLRAQGMLEIWQDAPRAAATSLARAVASSRDAGESLSTLRSRLMLERALQRLGDSASAAAHRDSIRRELRVVNEPTMLYWAGQRLARAGDHRGAAEALDSLRARMVASNPSHRAALQLLAGELDLARGDIARGLASIEAGARADSSEISFESRAYGLWRAGRIDEARQLYSQIGSASPAFTFEFELARRSASDMAKRLSR